MSRRTLWIGMLAVAVLPYFINLGATSIIDANEAFYAETPREMLEAGDYLNSTFNYEPRFNKPPLSYWIVAVFYHAFGVSLWSARVPIALGALVTIATAFGLGRLAFSPRAAWLAALTLAVTPRFLLFSRRIIIDIYSSMFLGLTLLCFALAETDPRRRRWWLLAMYAATGLGVLTKGPVAIVIPALVFPAYLAATGRLGAIRHLMLPTGALLVGAIVLPYYVALYAEHGWSYISTFLIQENLARYAEGVGAPSRGPLFYVPVVLADLYFPWSLLLPVALALVPWRRLARWPGWRGVGGGTSSSPVSSQEIRLLLALWIVLIVAFYSASRGQQDLYVLPFVPAGAALVGGLLDGLLGGSLPASLARWARAGVVVMFVTLAALGVAIAWLVGGPGEATHIAGVRPAAAMLAAGGVAAVIVFVRGAPGTALLVSGTALAAAMWGLVLVSLPDFERFKPIPRLAAAIDALPERPDRVGMYRVAAPSAVFYLRRHVAQMFDPRQLADFFAGHDRVYVLVEDVHFEDAQQAVGTPLRIVAEAPRFDAQLRTFLRRAPPPRMLLVTNSPDS